MFSCSISRIKYNDKFPHIAPKRNLIQKYPVGIAHMALGKSDKLIREKSKTEKLFIGSKNGTFPSMYEL